MKKIATVIITMLMIAPILSLTGMAEHTYNSIPEFGSPDTHWPMFRQNLENSGHSYSPVPQTDSLLWNHEVNTNHDADNPSVVAGGKLYIGTWTGSPNEYRGTLLCLDAKTGEEIWQSPIPYRVRSSPAIDIDKVYVNADNRWLYCLDSNNGDFLWRSYLSDEKGFLTQSSPMVTNGKVYIGVDSGAGEPGKVCCFDSETGVEIWSFQTAYGVTATPAISDGNLYVGTMDDYSFMGTNTAGSMYSINAHNGKLNWERLISKEFPLQLTSSPVISKGKLYVNAGLMRLGPTFGFTYCLDAETGASVWTRLLNNNLYTSPAVAYNRVFVNVGSSFVCFDAEDGEYLWEFDLPNGHSQSSPVVAKGKVFFAHSKFVQNNPNRAALTCLDALNGELQWSYKVTNNNPYIVYTSPSITNGIIYFGSKNNGVFAIGESKK